MHTPVKGKTSKSESAFISVQNAGILSSDTHHNLPDIKEHYQQGCCTQTCWSLLGSLCFLGGALCYIVNGAGWTYLEVQYGANAVTDYYYEEQKKLANGTDKLDQNYYQVKYQEIDGQFSWWEIAGASLYILNPVVDFLGGALGAFCLKPTEEMRSKVRPKCLYMIAWDSLGAVLFFVAACLYMINIWIAKAKFEYGEAYDVIDFFAVMCFVADACIYLTGRIVRMQLAAGTPQAKAICCCGPDWTGFVSLDFGLYGDIFFIIGALVEVYDHFNYSNAANLVAQSLWALDAMLYLMEWILVNTTRDGLRFSERSVGKRYSGVSKVSRRQSLLNRINTSTSLNGGTRPTSATPNTPDYGTLKVEEC